MIQEMTTMRIAADKEKEQKHEIPLFPCSIYISNWQKGGLEGCHWHWHKDLELMYIISGSLCAQCNNQSVVLQQGDGVFVNSRALHSYQVVGDEPCHACYFIFHPDFVSGGAGTIFHQKYIQPLISDHTFPCQFLYGAVNKDKEILARIYHAFQSAKESAIGYEYDVRHEMSKALLELLTEYMPLAYHSKKQAPQMERLQEMLDFLHWHFNEDISLGQIAESAGVSTREAQRCFRSVLAMSPMEYLHHYRLQVAEELLITSTDSILEVGLSCGFGNASHFIKSFRKYRGCTPRVFRQRNS